MFVSGLLLISFHKIPDNLENRLVRDENRVLVVVECRVVIGEGIAAFVLEEDGRHPLLGEGIMVAIAS